MLHVHALNTSGMHTHERKVFQHKHKCQQCNKELENDFVDEIVKFTLSFVF